jgi:hypothetical protein
LRVGACGKLGEKADLFRVEVAEDLADRHVIAVAAHLYDIEKTTLRNRYIESLHQLHHRLTNLDTHLDTAYE